MSRTKFSQGDVIEYRGMLAEVVLDDGGERIRVKCDGSFQEWFYEFEGIKCTLVSSEKTSN